jgi:hypothetical protein
MLNLRGVSRQSELTQEYEETQMGNTEIEFLGHRSTQAHHGQGHNTLIDEPGNNIALYSLQKHLT